MPSHTFGSAIKDRLQRLIVANGYSASGLALAMGRSNTWLSRKLVGARPLFVTDVDDVCAFLEVPGDSILCDEPQANWVPCR